MAITVGTSGTSCAATHSTSSAPSSRPGCDVSQTTIRSPPASATYWSGAPSRSWLPASLSTGIGSGASSSSARACSAGSPEFAMSPVTSTAAGAGRKVEHTRDGRGQRGLRRVVVEADVRVAELGQEDHAARH